MSGFLSMYAKLNKIYDNSDCRLPRNCPAPIVVNRIIFFMAFGFYDLSANIQFHLIFPKKNRQGFHRLTNPNALSMSGLCLQAKSHVGGDVSRIVVDPEVFGVDYIILFNPAVEYFIEAKKRSQTVLLF